MSVISPVILWPGLHVVWICMIIQGHHKDTRMYPAAYFSAGQVCSWHGDAALPQIQVAQHRVCKQLIRAGCSPVPQQYEQMRTTHSELCVQHHRNQTNYSVRSSNSVFWYFGVSRVQYLVQVLHTLNVCIIITLCAMCASRYWISWTCIKLNRYFAVVNNLDGFPSAFQVDFSPRNWCQPHFIIYRKNTHIDFSVECWIAVYDTLNSAHKYSLQKKQICKVSYVVPASGVMGQWCGADVGCICWRLKGWIFELVSRQFPDCKHYAQYDKKT